MAKVKRKSRILQEGEATGHAHRACAQGVVYEDGGRVILQSEQGTTITHEEHGPVVVPSGTYDVGIVREYDHFAEESRKVRD